MSNANRQRLKFRLEISGSIGFLAVAMALVVFGRLPLQGQSMQTTTSTPIPGSPKFEVASIKLCKDGETGGVARSGSGGEIGTSSPGRLIINCESVKSLIWYAYDIYANGPRLTSSSRAEHLLPPIEGGPGWIMSDRYRIDAKSDFAASLDTMRGPMLRVLLEDRFNLKIHRSTREVPAYALIVARSGPKLPPFQEGECFVLGEQPPNGKPACGRPRPRAQNATSIVWDIPGLNAVGLANTLQRLVNRPVIDKTGITGPFDIHLEFGLDENLSPFLRRECGPECSPLPAAPDPDGPPSIFTALQEQLGLRLEPTKGSGETLIIDHVERPTEN
jgi:uncharacterized protein (TIGR03435 family)